MEPFVPLYLAVLKQIRQMQLTAITPTQALPKKTPFVQVQLVNANPTDRYRNAREYTYQFQIDLVCGDNELTLGLNLASQLMQQLRCLTVPNYQVVLVNDPNLEPLDDRSTSKTYNRLLMNVEYQIIDTAVV